MNELELARAILAAASSGKIFVRHHETEHTGRYVESEFVIRMEGVPGDYVDRPDPNVRPPVQTPPPRADLRNAIAQFTGEAISERSVSKAELAIRAVLAKEKEDRELKRRDQEAREKIRREAERARIMREEREALVKGCVWWLVDALAAIGAAWWERGVDDLTKRTVRLDV